LLKKRLLTAEKQHHLVKIEQMPQIVGQLVVLKQVDCTMQHHIFRAQHINTCIFHFDRCFPEWQWIDLQLAQR